MYENDFVKEIKSYNMTDPLEILNWYRNLYHAEDNHTEHGIVAYAINALFMSLKDSDKKQIAMSVKSDGDDEQDWAYCPRCLEMIGDNEWMYDVFYHNKDHVYCQHCGQKLKGK